MTEHDPPSSRASDKDSDSAQDGGRRRRRRRGGPGGRGSQSKRSPGQGSEPTAVQDAGSGSPDAASGHAAGEARAGERRRRRRRKRPTGSVGAGMEDTPSGSIARARELPPAGTQGERQLADRGADAPARHTGTAADTGDTAGSEPGDAGEGRRGRNRRTRSRRRRGRDTRQLDPVQTGDAALDQHGPRSAGAPSDQGDDDQAADDAPARLRAAAANRARHAAQAAHATDDLDDHAHDPDDDPDDDRDDEDDDALGASSARAALDGDGDEDSDATERGTFGADAWPAAGGFRSRGSLSATDDSEDIGASSHDDDDDSDDHASTSVASGAELAAAEDRDFFAGLHEPEPVAVAEPPADDPDPVTHELELGEDDERQSLEAEVRSLVGIKFSSAGRIYLYDAGDDYYRRGEEVVVESERGVRIGVVAVDTMRQPSNQQGLKRVLRRPNQGDRRAVEKAQERSEEALATARKVARRLEMPIKIFRAEHSQTGKRVLIYFTAEERIDFRELVRELTQELGGRIEMRQTGVRDEAKMLGGIGSCGLELCCTTWLPEFVPVSIKMAKDQGLVLNPTKVSGQCGRLKCCLVYEQATYAELRKGLPKLGKRVVTDSGEGRVVEVDVLRQRVRVSLGPGEFRVFTGDEVKPLFPSQPQKKPPRKG